MKKSEIRAMIKEEIQKLNEYNDDTKKVLSYLKKYFKDWTQYVSEPEYPIETEVGGDGKIEVSGFDARMSESTLEAGLNKIAKGLKIPKSWTYRIGTRPSEKGWVEGSIYLWEANDPEKIMNEIAKIFPESVSSKYADIEKMKIEGRYYNDKRYSPWDVDAMVNPAQQKTFISKALKILKKNYPNLKESKLRFFRGTDSYNENYAWKCIIDLRGMKK